MGNKQSGVSLSGSQQHVAEPTSRSFSWQPDPLFSGEPVKRGESFTGPGARPGDHLVPNSGSVTLHRTLPYAASEFSSPGVYRHRQASSPNLATSNGSVVRGDAAFGGVQKEFMKPTSKTNASKPANLVNTADSGYMTEIAAQDSDNSARGRLRGSRLSLNDAMLGGTEFIQQQQQQPPPMMHPPGMPLGPHFMHMPPPPGMVPFGPPPGFGPPPDPFLFPPMMNPRGAPLDEKKAKKMRKKQQKNQGQLSRQSSMLGDMPAPGEFIPPYSMISGPVIAYGPPHPPPPQVANFRSRSIDNFAAAGLIQPGPMIAPLPPPPHMQPGPQNMPVRRYNSHIDISGVGVGVNYSSSTLGPGMGMGVMMPGLPVSDNRDKTPPVKKERKYEKRKDQAPGSLRDSLNSSRGRLADAPFGIGKTATGLKTSASIEARNGDDKDEKNDLAFGQAKLSSENSRPHRSEVIYETLKGAQRAMLATSAEINTITVNANIEKEKRASEKTVEKETVQVNAIQDSPPPPTPKPVIITPEAKAVLERNARILVEAEREEKQERALEDTKTSQSNAEQKRSESQQTPVISKMVDELRKIPTPPPPPPMPPTDGQRFQKEAHKADRVSKDSRDETLDRSMHAEKKAMQMTETEDQMRKTEKYAEKSSDQQSKTVSSSEKLSSSSNDPDDIESMIEATLNPILPRRKYKRPKDFEPLDAWRGINVQQELVKRQPQRNAMDTGNRDQQSVVEERIQVRLVPSPPSKREQTGTEPIYLEYDERLPEFKKRLIETGSFDIPEVEKYHHRSNSQLSAGSRGRLDMSPTRWEMNVDRIPNGAPDGHNQQRQSQPQIWRDYVAMEEAAANVNAGHGSIRSRKTVDSSKGSLRRLKESMASIFRTKSSDQLRPTANGAPLSTATDDLPPLYTPAGGRYAPSLTPSTSKIKAGDSSDIDFSWVHDLETRFRLEREQFERELQTLKQKSATIQKNDYMLSPKLQRQHSYQPRINSEVEIGREENRYSPSLRGPPPQNPNDRQTRYNDDLYRDKTFSSSIDLSGRGATTSPPPGRMNAYHSQQALNDNVPSSRLMLDQESKSKYFGIYDTAPGNPTPNAQSEIGYRDPYERSFRNELHQMVPANVRQKAAIFENESQRVQREMDERNSHLARQKQQRSSSAPQRFQQQPYRMSLQSQRSIEADEPIYIPRPDYDENANEQPRSNMQHRRQNSAGRISNGHSHPEASNGVDYPGGVRYGKDDRLFGPPYMDEPLAVNTASNGQPRSGFIASPRSPSERRLARFYNSHANITNGSRATSNGGVRYESQPALNAVSPQRYEQYSPSSRSPRMARAQPPMQYQESARPNPHWGRNGFDNGHQQQMIKANRMGGPRSALGGSRGVAFANE